MEDKVSGYSRRGVYCMCSELDFCLLLSGWAEGGPYDAIHVGAAAPTLPQPLVDQLARPGRMFIPVGTHSQAVLQVDKHEDGSVTKKELFGVVVRPFGPFVFFPRLLTLCGVIVRAFDG